jgi:hypothetical protein
MDSLCNDEAANLKTISVLFGVCHEGVEAGHDLWAFSVDEPPEAVARVPLPLVEVVQDTGRPVLLGDPIDIGIHVKKRIKFFSVNFRFNVFYTTNKNFLCRLLLQCEKRRPLTLLN